MMNILPPCRPCVGTDETAEPRTGNAVYVLGAWWLNTYAGRPYLNVFISKPSKGAGIQERKGYSE